MAIKGLASITSPISKPLRDSGWDPGPGAPSHCERTGRNRRVTHNSETKSQTRPEESRETSVGKLFTVTEVRVNGTTTDVHRWVLVTHHGCAKVARSYTATSEDGVTCS